MKNSRALGWAGLIVGTLGVLLAIYFFIESQEERQLVFQLSGTPSLVANPAESGLGRIKVVRPDGSRIDRPVWAQNFTVWNPSSISIKEENILLPLIMSFDDSDAEIVEFAITDELRPKVSRGKLHIDDKNTVRLSFVILEKKDAIVGQITYIGDQDSSLSLRGAIEGVSEIHSAPEIDWLRFFLYFIYGLLIFVAIILAFMACVGGIFYVASLIGKKIPVKYKTVVENVGAWIPVAGMFLMLFFLIGKIAFENATKIAPSDEAAPVQIEKGDVSND